MIPILTHSFFLLLTLSRERNLLLNPSLQFFIPYLWSRLSRGHPSPTSFLGLGVYKDTSFFIYADVIPRTNGGCSSRALGSRRRPNCPDTIQPFIPRVTAQKFGPRGRGRIHKPPFHPRRGFIVFHPPINAHRLLLFSSSPVRLQSRVC